MNLTLTQQCDVIYLATNGTTIEAYECANIGDVGIINGVEYTVVDRDILDQMIDNQEDLTKVCTTRVTDMNNLFICHEDFNQPIGNVSYVTNMERMFFLATSFNQELGGWDTIEVTNMQMMFYSATNFNQQSLGGWDVGNVTNMQMMFYSATNFNQSLAGWEVGNVTNMQMMFANTDFFNQDLTYWDVVNVTNCSSFSMNNSQWTEPKPNFINCDPN